MEGKEQVRDVVIAAEKDERGWYVIIHPAVPIMGWKSIHLGYEEDEHGAKARVAVFSELLRQQGHPSGQK